MKHIATAEIPKSEFKRVNKLLAIPSLSELSDKELRSLGANTDQCEGILYVEFDDGSHLSYDLCSGQENYFDDVVWSNPDGSHDVLLDCSFELADIEFEVDGEEYVVHIVQTETTSTGKTEMKTIALTDGDYASKWGLSDFYPESKKRLTEALRSDGEFTTGWFGCRKEIEYAKIERLGGKLIVNVACHMDDLFDSADLIYDALWTVSGREFELSDDIVDSIRDWAIDSGIEDCTVLFEELPPDASVDDVVPCLDRLSQKANANNDEMYHELCQCVELHVDQMIKE